MCQGADPTVVEVVALDLIDDEDGVGPHHEIAIRLFVALGVLLYLVDGFQKSICVPHWPLGTSGLV